MNNNRDSLNSLFIAGRLLEIPFYQREYVWRREQWERFLDDMVYVSKVNRPYFLGSVILKQLITPSNAASEARRMTDKRLVIDGQQRLTTIMLFFKALYLRTDMDDMFYRQFCFVDKSPLLEHGKADGEHFSAIMALTPEKAKENKEKLGGAAPEGSVQSNIVDAFNYFYDEIDPTDINELNIVKNLGFYVIDVNPDEDEQQIFDTINSLGVTLTTAELLKNYLFDKDNVSEFEKYWEPIFEKDEETRKWWNQEIVTGRIRRTMVDLFFDAFLQILVQDPRFGVTADEKIAYERVDQLFHSYQSFLKKYFLTRDPTGMRGFLEKMSRYAILFMETVDPNATKHGVKRDDRLGRLNVVVFGLKSTTLIPYILYIEGAVDDEQERSEIWRLLEAYMMRRIITRETTKNYNRLFTSLILNEVNSAVALREILEADDEATTRVPSNNEIEAAFSTETRLTNLQAKGILYLMEVSIRPKDVGSAILAFDSYSLEHLMPKKWRNHWDIPDGDEAIRDRDRKLLTLGNLAIITQPLNASIRDADWKTKKSGKGNRDGLAKCNGGLTTFEGVLDKEAWDEAAIAERATALGKCAIASWQFDKDASAH